MWNVIKGLNEMDSTYRCDQTVHVTVFKYLMKSVTADFHSINPR